MSLYFSHASYARNSQITLEFCLAENTPADNWAKHAVPDTDDIIYVSPTPALTGSDIKTVSFIKNDNGYPTIEFTLTNDGNEKMWHTTSENIGKRLVILLDEKVVSAPTISSGIKNTVAVSGRFDNDDLLKFFTAIVLVDT